MKFSVWTAIGRPSICCSASRQQELATLAGSLCIMKEKLRASRQRSRASVDKELEAALASTSHAGQGVTLTTRLSWALS